MDNETIERRRKWVAEHPELDVKPSMKRRKEGHDYSGRCIYMVTLCIDGRKPLLGTLRGDDAGHSQPWVEPSGLGLKVIEQWSNISVENPKVSTVAFQLMPDHVHGIVFVKEPLERHVGHIISRFKAKTTAAFRHMCECSETQSRTIVLWEPGYNDRILFGNNQLQRWVDYLRDNPRRLWVKRHNPELFTVRNNIKISGTSVAVMGNVFLLDHPYKAFVQCSRSLSSEEIEVACSRFLSMASDGAVLVSPCISPGEKEIMRRAFDVGFPSIILLENGFTPLQKPKGRQFDACADGRLLLVAPWEHHNDYRVITREQCLALNRMARDIVSCETASRSTST